MIRGISTERYGNLPRHKEKNPYANRSFPNRDSPILASFHSKQPLPGYGLSFLYPCHRRVPLITAGDVWSKSKMISKNLDFDITVHLVWVAEGHYSKLSIRCSFSLWTIENIKNHGTSGLVGIKSLAKQTNLIKILKEPKQSSEGRFFALDEGARRRIRIQMKKIIIRCTRFWFAVSTSK